VATKRISRSGISTKPEWGVPDGRLRLSCWDSARQFDMNTVSTGMRTELWLRLARQPCCRGRAFRHCAEIGQVRPTEGRRDDGLRRTAEGPHRRSKAGKGKCGGARVIYLYVPEAKWFFMLDIYDKDEQENLSVTEKKELAKLLEEFRQQANAAVKRGLRRKK
jgi:hypothetical protein